MNATPALSRRRFVQIIGGTACGTTFVSAFADAFPTKPIRLIVGYPAGSSSDLMARMIAKPLSEILKTPVIVEQKPGASSSVAAAFVARAPADGYTLYYGLQDSQLLVPLLKRNVPYDAKKDFTPIAEVVDLNLVLVANSSTNLKSVAQFLARAKEKQGEMTFGSSGIGGVHHLTMEMLMQKTGVKLHHVPYQGGGPALTGLLRGDVDVMVGSEALVRPYVLAGNLNALATTGKRRSNQLKGVPTLTEAGVPMTMSAWYGLFGPANLPEPIERALEEAARQATATAEYKQQIESVGAEVTYLGGADFARFLKSEGQTYRDAIQAAGIKIEDY